MEKKKVGGSIISAVDFGFRRVVSCYVSHTCRMDGCQNTLHCHQFTPAPASIAGFTIRSHEGLTTEFGRKALSSGWPALLGSTIGTNSLHQNRSRIIALRGCRGCSSPGVVASDRIWASTLFFASTRLTWLQMHDVFCGEMLTVSIAAGRLRGDVDGFYCRGAVVFEGFVKAGMGS